MRDAQVTDERLSEKIYDVLTEWVRYMKSTSNPAALSFERLSALRIIEVNGPLSIAALAEVEKVHASTMSRMVASLTRDGLVRRAADQDDGRASLITVTAKGRKECVRSLQSRLAELGPVLEGLSTRDRGTVEKGIAVLRKALRS